MTPTTLLLLGVAAVLVGFAKTAIGGVGSLAIAIFAFVLPTKESTAAILLLLLIGDVVAVWHYRRDADIVMLRRLIPAVLPGLALGALFLAWVDDATLRRCIGVLLLVLAAMQLDAALALPRHDAASVSRGRPPSARAWLRASRR